VSDSFSGALTVNVTPITSVPEPVALILMGGATVLLTLGFKRRMQNASKKLT
jgi:hypothetical protein